MKQLEKIILGLAIIIIIIGAIIVKIKGFNVDLKYTASNRIEISIGKEFELKDIKQITDEVLNEDVILQKVEVYEDSVSITAKEITDEQKNEIVNKINEKYELEVNADEISISNISKTRLYDIAKQYVLAFSIITIIILVYMAIKYRKLGALAIVIKTLLTIVIAELTLAGIVAIVRIPVGVYSMAIVLLVYVFTIMCITSKYEKKLLEIKKEKNSEMVK